MERPEREPDPSDPIERALRAGGEHEPGPRFAARVMAAVRREAATPPPLAFPWRRLVLGIAAALWLLLGYRAIAGGDAAEVRAFAQRWELLAGVGLLLGLLSLRLARFCVRS